MAACRECHSELSAGDRFCSSCGVVVDTDSSQSNDGFELLGTTGGSETGSVDVQRSGRNRSRVFVVVALALGGLVLFTLLRSPELDPDDPENAELRSDNEGSGGNGIEDDELDKWTTTTEGDQAVATRRSTTSTVPLLADVSYIGDGQPLLGEETGLYLFIGGESSKLRRIDLDTGEVVEYLDRVFPSFASDGYLVGTNPDSGRAKVMLIDDPTVDTGVFLNSGYFYPGSSAALPGPEPGQLWVIGDDFPSPSWRLTRLSDGEVLQEIELATQNFYGPTLAGPMVAGSPSGGIFDLRDGTYVRVADGTPLAISTRFVLAEDCSSPIDCELRWLSRETWQEVDRALPELRPQWAQLSADGRVLMFYTDRGTELFDVERGRTVEGVGGDPENTAVSPDGRYVFTNTGILRIHDLDSDEVFTLDGLTMRDWSSGLFVEKP